MDKRWAALGTSAFFAVGPGVVAGVIPRRLIRGKLARPLPGGRPVRAAGAVLVAGGGTVVARAFVRLVVEGAGTPAPVAPPEHLVVGGVYRHVRNPMYVAVATTIVGQALLYGQPRLLLYAAGALVPAALFVRFYEEPTLLRKFGTEYEDYRRNVPGWLPRLRAWDPDGGASTKATA